MIVTVDISGDSGEYWQPLPAQLQAWSEAALLSAGHVGDTELSLRIVDAKESAHLNNDYRGKNAPTNVLSFPVVPFSLPQELNAEAGLGLLGDLVICPEVVETEAKAQGKTVANHWAHLVVHGTLHLLGHVHDSDEQAAAMEALEINALQKLGISNPYLVG